jgi:hypothetical protein
MTRAKFEVGEVVEMRCTHRRAGRLVTDWLVGIVAATDYRMLAVRFDTEVFVGAGQRLPDQTLWCSHGSRNLRRPTENAADIQTEEVSSPE